MDSNNWDDYSIFWKETIKQLQNELPEQTFVMWFKNIRFESSNQTSITLSVPSAFFRENIQQRFLSIIESKLFELSGHKLSVQFEVKGTQNTEAPPSETIINPEPEKKEQPAPVKKKPKIRKHHNLIENYIFDSFVIGDNNSFAANAGIAIAKNPGTAYNPCLIYGDVGLGKTHLIQAIGNSAYQSNPDLKIEYVTAESFTNEFIQGIKDKKMPLFKNKYRKVDILLIDDIHFLQKKDETQEELFHTFNALYDGNKQMVFTCDRPVSELKSLTDRLRSRFERGLNVDLQPPSFETRFAILKKKVESSNLVISDSVIELISRNVTTNVRDLEKALTKLIAYGDLVNKDITLEIAQQQLKDIFSNPRQNNISIDLIQRVVAEDYALSPFDLKGKKRTKAIAFPRQIAMYIIRELTEHSTTEIGREFGRDHTTVMHACQRIETRLKTDPNLESKINRLVRIVKDQGIKSS